MAPNEPVPTTGTSRRANSTKILIQALTELRMSGVDEARAISLPRIGKKGKLRDDQHFTVDRCKIEVDFSFRIGKDAQFLYLLPKLGTILLIYLHAQCRARLNIPCRWKIDGRRRIGLKLW